jgi:hypothetical protein
VATEALGAFPELPFDLLLERVVAACAHSLKLPSHMSSRLRLFPSQKRRDLATLSEIIERLEASRRPPTHTFPFVDGPSSGASYGDARTDQLMTGLAAGRSATLGANAVQQDSSPSSPTSPTADHFAMHVHETPESLGLPPASAASAAMASQGPPRFRGLAAAAAYNGGSAGGSLAAATAALRLGSPHSSLGSQVSPDEYSDADSAGGGHTSQTAAGAAPRRSRSGSVWCFPDQAPYFVQRQEGLSEVSLATREKAAACRYYIQQHYIHLNRARVERIRRRQDIEEEMLKQQLPEDHRVKVRTALICRESEYLRRLRAPISLSLFQPLKRIGRGAFGEVTLVRGREDDRVYAMKALSKADVIARKQVAHVKAERDILAEADNEWVVRLHYSFQDQRHLYFVMDYVPVGGGQQVLTFFF